MRFQLRFDIKSWMFGIAFDRYNFMLSIGPVYMAVANERKYIREMEQHILENGGLQ